MAPHCSDWMAEPPARPLVPWLRRILSMSRQIQDSILCAIPSCNPRHCRATRQKQSQTVAFAHLRWGLVTRGRLAIPAGCIGWQWFFIDCVYKLPRVLLKQAQPQRLKPIEFWPNGTTEVVPFPRHWQPFQDTRRHKQRGHRLAWKIRLVLTCNWARGSVSSNPHRHCWLVL